jgi:hypothetical protein
MKTRIVDVCCVTSSELTSIEMPAELFTSPVSVLIVAPSGIVIAGSLAAAVSAGPSPFDGSNPRHRVPSEAQPRAHAVVVTDVPLASHVVSSSPAHDVAPGEHPQRSTGHSGGTIVHTFFAPPDASNSPFTSQNG